MAVAGYVKVYAKRKGRLPKQLRHARFPADAKALYAGNSTNSSSSGRGHAYPCCTALWSHVMQSDRLPWSIRRAHQRRAFSFLPI